MGSLYLLHGLGTPKYKTLNWEEESAWNECFGSQFPVICPYDDESFEHSIKSSISDRRGSDWTFCSIIGLLSRSKLHCCSNSDSNSNSSAARKVNRKCILRYSRKHPQTWVSVVMCIEACQMTADNGFSWWQKETIREECFSWRKSVKFLNNALRSVLVHR